MEEFEYIHITKIWCNNKSSLYFMQILSWRVDHWLVCLLYLGWAEPDSLQNSHTRRNTCTHITHFVLYCINTIKTSGISHIQWIIQVNLNAVINYILGVCAVTRRCSWIVGSSNPNYSNVGLECSSTKFKVMCSTNWVTKTWPICVVFCVKSKLSCKTNEK